VAQFHPGGPRAQHPVVMVNGRIGERSVENYRKMRRMFTKMLDTVVRFCMQSTIDAQYVIRLGADPHRVLVTGNTKYDQNYSQVTAANSSGSWLNWVLPGRAGHHRRQHASRRRGNPAGHLQGCPCSVAASQTDDRSPDIPRSPGIVELARRHGFTAELRSRLPELNEPRRVDIVVLDTIGELGRLYSLATWSSSAAAWCRTAATTSWNRPPRVNRSWWDRTCSISRTPMPCFRRNACMTALDGAELAEKTLRILTEPDLARRMGDEALTIVQENRGAAVRTVESLKEILTEREATA
jgi:3-deoxy-D-manno-octulosonic-acid transferase